MSPPRISVLVLNWNGYEDTAACLHSLARSDYANQEILVVDNGSTDGSGERLQREFPGCRFHFTGENRGYAGGNNAGFEAALESGADYVLVLNNDTLVEADAVRRLMEVADVEDAGIVSAKIYYESERSRFWFAGGRIDIDAGTAINEGLNEKDHGQFNKIRPIDFASGCAMLVRRDVIEAVKGFDERYFLYFEEVDFCIRARAAGFRIVFAPGAVVWHKTGVAGKMPSPPHVRYYMTRNRWLFMRQVYTHIPSKVAAGYVREQFRIAASLLLHRQWRQFGSLWRAHRDAALGRFGAMGETVRGAGKARPGT